MSDNGRERRGFDAAHAPAGGAAPASRRTGVRILTLLCFIGIGGSLAQTGCEKGWRRDMWEQPALRAEEAPRPEPAGSIPVGAGPRVANRDEADSLKNTIPPDSIALRHGWMLFENRCAPCHGKDGHGGGAVSKFFPPAPDLAESAVVGRSDGYIYGTIVFGGKAMPGQPEGLTMRDRWELVDVVRAVQKTGPAQKTGGVAAETSPAAGAPGAAPQETTRASTPPGGPR